MQQMGSMNNPKVSLRHVHPWRMAVSGVVILAAGITIGAAGAMVFGHATEPRRTPMDPNVASTNLILRWSGPLHLTHDQQEKIRKVLYKGFVALDKIRNNAQPEIEKALQTTMEETDKLLTEEQRSEWKQMISDGLARRFGRGMGPGFGPGFDPRYGPGRNSMRGGGRSDWPGGPGGGGMGPGFDPRFGPGGSGGRGDWRGGPDDHNRRGGYGPGDPNAFRSRSGEFGPGDPNAYRGGRPSWLGSRGPNDVRPSQWRGRDPNAFGPPNSPPRPGESDFH